MVVVQSLLWSVWGGRTPRSLYPSNSALGGVGSFCREVGFDVCGSVGAEATLCVSSPSSWQGAGAVSGKSGLECGDGRRDEERKEVQRGGVV